MAGGRLLPVLLGALEEMKDSAIKNTSEKKKEEGENSAFPHLIERAEVGKALKFRFADRTEGGGGRMGHMEPSKDTQSTGCGFLVAAQHRLWAQMSPRVKWSWPQRRAVLDLGMQGHSSAESRETNINSSFPPSGRCVPFTSGFFQP